MAFLSGKVGGVLVGGVGYAFGKWKFAFNAKEVSVNNFLSQGFQQLVIGFTKGSITMSGPYDQGNMPLTAGNSYALTLQFTNAIVLTVTAFLTDLTPSNDAEGTPTVDCSFSSSGVFTASIV